MKAKKQYDVYLVQNGSGCYGTEENFVGSTWAVSEKQAINNVRYRTRDTDNPYGGPSEWSVGDYLEEGAAHYRYIAEEV